MRTAQTARAVALELSCTLCAKLNAPGSSNQQRASAAARLPSLVRECEDIVVNGTPPTAKKPYSSDSYTMAALSGLIVLLPFVEVGRGCVKKVQRGLGWETLRSTSPPTRLLTPHVLNVTGNGLRQSLTS
jgi:hypothetical protein